MNKINRIGVLTAGGDCPGLNAVVRAVTKYALQQGIEVYGFKNGFDGLVKNDFIMLDNKTVSGILTRGGTILGTSNIANPFRYTLAPHGTPESPKDVSNLVLENIEKNKIDALVAIGGDGTLSMAKQFIDKGVKIVGIPKTIDNDLSATDYTFGFDSALTVATDAVDRLHSTAEAHHRVMIIETMGRYAGWIALRSCIAGGGDICLIPEIPYNDDLIVNAILERKKQGKKEFEYTEEVKEKKVKISETDKESGYYHRDNKEKGFMYLDHRTVDDKCNIIVDAYITKGNVHDSIPFINRAEYIKYKFRFDIKKYAVDSGYLTWDIKKYFIDNDIFGVFGYRRTGTPSSRKEKNKYEYVQKADIYYEKETGEVLEYNGLIDKNGYKKYENRNKTKIIRRHIHEEWNEIFKKNRLSKEGKELYQKRKEHVERSFADSKQNHGYRYAMYKGVKKNQHYTWLICAAQNMKNISIKNDNVGKKPLSMASLIEKLSNLLKIFIKKISIRKPLEKSRGLSTL